MEGMPADSFWETLICQLCFSDHLSDLPSSLATLCIAPVLGLTLAWRAVARPCSCLYTSCRQTQSLRCKGERPKEERRHVLITYLSSL